MNTTITIEPTLRTRDSTNPQKRLSVNYVTTIPLEIPFEEAWDIIAWIVQQHIPNAKLETVSDDLGLDRYCFSVSGFRIIPEALDITIDV